MNSLAPFFKAPLYKNALASYAREAKSLKWDISDKLKLYNWAKQAFESDLTEEEQMIAFTAIYQELKSYWQVFRGARSEYWSSSEIYKALKQHTTACSRQNELSL